MRGTARRAVQSTRGRSRAPPRSAADPAGAGPVTVAPVSTAARIESADAANELFERYHDRVYAFCMSRTRNPTDAEDATQTAFMYALSGLRRGVVPRFELTWLLRIAENVCHSIHRRAYRRYERDELPDEASGPEDVSLVAERFEMLCAALESLPDRQRRAVLLREWRGLSYTEIADELDVSHAAVETLLFRARRSLAKQFGSLVVLPLPSLGRFVRWLGGTGSVKAAAVTAVTIGAATGVVSSSPVDRAPAQPAPTTSASTATVERVSPLLRAQPAIASTSTHSAVPAPVVPPSAAPAEPQVGAAEAGQSAREVPSVESPTSEPVAGVVDTPTIPTIVLPVDPAEPLAPIVELTAPLENELEQLPHIELPQLPQLPLP
jgi:RNA polymerase sigma factor (sigma-70 family)